VSYNGNLLLTLPPIIMQVKIGNNPISKYMVDLPPRRPQLSDRDERIQSARMKYQRLIHREDESETSMLVDLIKQDLQIAQRRKNTLYLDYSMLDPSGQRTSQEIEKNIDKILHDRDVALIRRAAEDMQSKDTETAEFATMLIMQKLMEGRVKPREIDPTGKSSDSEAIGKITYAVQIIESRIAAAKGKKTDGSGIV
jgi:hypothetical protein